METTIEEKDGLKNVKPYLLCAYNGSENFSSYLNTNNKGQDDKSINRIFSRGGIKIKNKN